MAQSDDDDVVCSDGARLAGSDGSSENETFDTIDRNLLLPSTQNTLNGISKQHDLNDSSEYFEETVTVTAEPTSLIADCSTADFIDISEKHKKQKSIKKTEESFTTKNETNEAKENGICQNYGTS